MRTPRKNRWRPTPTWMILWWRTSRRQRLTQGIPFPLLSSPPLRTRCNPCGSRASEFFHLCESPFHGRHTSLQWHTASASRNPSVRKEFGRQILRGEFIDFTLLLSDSLTQPQVPKLQLRLDDLSPGSLSSPLSKVRKRKQVIDTFHTWLDAYTTYMLVIVAAYPRRSIEQLKYQQIISREETQFQGLAWVSYDDQSSQGRKRPSLSWDQVDLDLWTVLFSGLAKPHCLTCCSPYYKQSECPSADHSRRQPKGPVCFKFNR